MKKVEVYFLINLGAILSLFAIEGELAEYKERQNDILLTAADDKLKTLVQINNVKSNYDDENFYRLTFDLEGEYERGTVEFEPSFTTKSSGMGLGLSMIQSIMAAYNGSITFKSKENQGTIFKVEIPKKLK